jgi:hypothetical protein
MNTILTLSMILVAIALFVSYIASRPRGKQLSGFVNEFTDGTHACGALNLFADAALATKHLLVKQGSDASHIAVCGAADLPKGICKDSPGAAEDLVHVVVLGSSIETQLAIASAAIAAGIPIYTAAAGKVQSEPTAAGTYYMVGYSITAAGADGDKIEFDPITPIKVVVIAALTSTNGTAAAAADLAALKVEAEKIGDDVRALAAALATPALVKVLSA